MKLKFRLKFNHVFTNHGYLRSALWKTLYNFKIKRAQEARYNHFVFKMLKTMRSLRSSKRLKTTVELTLTTQKANASSPWTACSVVDWKYLSWVNLARKFKMISLSWNLYPSVIQISRIPWWCLLFLFSTGNTFLS